MSAHILRSSCKSGELSPLMDSRVDAENYSTGCRRLENFIPRIYGGAFRRVGTMFLGIAKDESKPVRLFPFNYSGDTAVVSKTSFLGSTEVPSARYVPNPNVFVSSFQDESGIARIIEREKPNRIRFITRRTEIHCSDTTKRAPVDSRNEVF